MIDERTRANPRYRQLVENYRVARRAWATDEETREAAATLGMDERRYCDSFLFHNCAPILTVASNTNPWGEFWNTGVWDAAYAEAAPQ